MNASIQERINTVRAKLGDLKNCGALFITKPENIFYVSQFRGDDSCMFLTENAWYFITDKRYSDEAETFFSRSSVIKVLVTSAKKDRYVLCHTLMKKHRIKRVGFESQHLSYYAVSKLQQYIGARNVEPCVHVIEALRMIKSRDELKTISKAVKLNEETFKYVRARINEKRSETALVDMAERRMKETGAQGASFPTIVASARKSAFPHAHSAATRIKKNTIVLVDMGTRYRGYCSDMTRTFFLGKRSRFYRDIYDIVLTAQETAFSRLKPGEPIASVEKAVQTFFKKCGYLSHFTHSLGHGVGLEVHELPYMTTRTSAVLREGMVFTVEPALYFPGCGGIRIEDMVYITKTGFRKISQYPRTIEYMTIGNGKSKGKSIK